MYQRYLDELGYPEGVEPHIKSANATKTSRYGQFLRRTDPVQFEVGFKEWKREMENKRRNK